MKVVLLGASGMVGQGVIRECTLAPDISEVLSIVRKKSEQAAPKVRELVPADLYDLSPLKADLTAIDACFFCLGVSAAGMSEDEYRHVTYELTLNAARVLHEVSPNATFIYVSGQGTDSSEKGRAMWARVKGKTENDLLALLPNAYMFRPGLIRPMHGAVSKTRLYRVSYVLLWPFMPMLQALFPRAVTNTELVGRAMLNAARNGAPKRVLESADIDALSRA